MTAATVDRLALARDACRGAGYLAKPFGTDALLAAVVDRLGGTPPH